MSPRVSIIERVFLALSVSAFRRSYRKKSGRAPFGEPRHTRRLKTISILRSPAIQTLAGRGNIILEVSLCIT